MKKILLACVLVALVGCGVKLPPIVITVPPKPTEPIKPVPSDPPPVPVDPKPEPEPEPPVDRPLVNLNITVHDARGVGIAKAVCAISGLNVVSGTEERVADGGGFINFAVMGPVDLSCSALGFIARTADIPPGDHRFPLVAVEPPKPVDPKPDPKPDPAPSVFAECGAAENTLRISHDCLQVVARASTEWPSCAVGSQHACHFYVREVARALNAAQGQTRWGLITKPGGSNVEGYGEDVVAWLPQPFGLTDKTWRWRGIDIIGGAGAPGARFQGGELHEAIPCSQWKDGMPWCNREDNLWAPVPK